jgi:uncharacterized protein (DUF1015 family)
MALVNMDDPELVVLPTHRIATVPDDFDVEAFWASLERDFDVLASPAQDVLAVLSDADARATFVIKVDGSPPRAIRLKPDVDLTAAVPGAASDAWKTLDVAVLQELVLAPLFGIHPDRPETLEKLRFCKEAGDALRVTGPAEIAFLLRPTRVDQLREVALSGEMMPQKSTYFYPKLLSGLLMRSLDY